MKAVRLTKDKINDFREYFLKYSHEQDESFPPLDSYSVRDDESGFLLIGEKNEIIGAAVLMLHDEYIEAGEARFRMFHCIDHNVENYRCLLDSILSDINSRQVILSSIYCYVESKYEIIASAWEQLGFETRRYAWILVRAVEGAAEPVFPEGYEIRTLRDGIDENTWCDIINEAFENILGHVRMRPEKIIGWRKEPVYIAGGMKFLWYENKPVATVAMTREENDGEDVVFIENIAVLNEFQHKGLGRNLLRYCIRFAKDFGVKRVMLSVNAENEKAAELYFNEGFTKEALYICYHFNIK